MPPRQVRAVFDPDTITVYQAYGHEIADAAVAAGRFVDLLLFPWVMRRALVGVGRGRLG